MARPTASAMAAMTRYRVRLLRMSASPAQALPLAPVSLHRKRVPAHPPRAQNRAQRARRGILVDSPAWTNR
jgi:hypothetical protein